MAYTKKRHLLSYLAGVFDGEGCVCLSKSTFKTKKGLNPTYLLKVSVNMCDAAPPRLFCNIWGGSLHIRRNKGINHRNTLTWDLCGTNCLPFLRELLPYVLIKRPQFEVAIHFLENVEPAGIRHYRLSDEQLALREADFILAKEMKHENGGVI